MGRRKCERCSGTGTLRYVDGEDACVLCDGTGEVETGGDATCKSCGADIVFVRTPAGKLTPVDAKKTRVALLEKRDEELRVMDVFEGHVSHFATCPAADVHRRRASGR